MVKLLDYKFRYDWLLTAILISVSLIISLWQFLHYSVTKAAASFRSPRLLTTGARVSWNGERTAELAVSDAVAYGLAVSQPDSDANHFTATI